MVHCWCVRYFLPLSVVYLWLMRGSLGVILSTSVLTIVDQMRDRLVGRVVMLKCCSVGSMLELGELGQSQAFDLIYQIETRSVNEVRRRETINLSLKRGQDATICIRGTEH